MSYIKFSDWLFREFTDVFGFDREVRMTPKNKKLEWPVKQLNIERVMDTLGAYNLRTKEAHIKFVNEVHWGEGSQAIRVLAGTGLNFFIDRRGYDLQGVSRWITKKIYQVDQTGIGDQEEKIAQELFEVIKRLDEQPVDSAQHEFKDIENLVINMAGKIKRTAHDVFVYEGVKKVEDNDYVIRLSVRGQGQVSRDNWTVKENQTHIVFDPKTGLIRIMNYDVGTKSEGRSWMIRPSEIDLYFCPTQSREEISEAIANTLHWF